MNFQQEAVLIGVVGKKGTGKLDNGDTWATDRVELHCLAPFDGSDTMANGQTVMVYQVDDFAKNYDAAKALIDQKVLLRMSMIPAKKLGQAPKIVCTAFEAAPRTAKEQAAAMTK